MARLPSVLGTADLPLPELCAARIDGELMPFGDGWVPIDEPDLIGLRAEVLARRADRDLIVERRSAAWLLGALVAPPDPPQFCVPMRARIAQRVARDFSVREVAIDDDEIITVAGLIRCTRPVRTVLDLARDTGVDERAAIRAAAALLQTDAELADEAEDRLRSAFRLPGKVRALERLATARAIAVTAMRQPSETR
ncbi:type IV toxin-antitoxin system AbiEi family antitoxin [Agromyces larvae]|uniref:AbiEi antitoxin C-terminal domain-containing protein n=1 Tax=Agromyces larvae TaxID=2929802 RepID=A0ABY4C173_9MICO|nr:type IV toxin-antitoxin system AbiEi family antitoxin [Agromyces larvae]UOE45230.1 hypothetical protein MTO99_05510 [Agromyces larvae]